MSSGSSRFRTGRVSAPATPADRLRRHLGDGDELVQVATGLLEPVLREPDARGALELMAVVREGPDIHRTYLLHKLAVQGLLRASNQVPRGADDMAWARYYDLIPALLLPYLEARPHEPELLNLLGLSYYELGETALARRLFEAVRTIEPEHFQARVNLKACKERAARGVGVPRPPEALTRHSRELHSAAKRIADIAVRLPERTVSLCMIVKDEEEMLPGCLAAVQGHVDEIIVCDTGSTDRTREIAAEFGAKVIEFPWTGSFSDARNRSVQDATGDWILYLDADEHVVEDDARHFRELARKTWVEGFYLVETHFTGQYEVGSQSSHMAMRMFQNRPNYRWTGIIHEQKLHNFPTYLPERFQNSPVRVNHYGYLSTVVEDRGKRSRNLDLLLQQAAEGGDDAFNQFNIGSEFAAMGDWAQARPYFERALEKASVEPAWQGHQFAPMMVSRLIGARRSLGDWDAALELIADALEWWPDFTDLVYERALILMARRQNDEAKAEAQRAIEMGDGPAKYVSVQGKGSYQARALLAHVLREEGDARAAREQLLTALEEAPHFLPNVLELAEVMLQLEEDPDDVAARIERVLGERAGGAAAGLMLATAMHEAGHFEQAERYYGRVLEASPGHAAAKIALAELRLAQHRFNEALELAASVDELDPVATRGARTEFLAAVVAGNAAALARPLRILTAADWLPMGTRAFYTAWHARITGGSAVLAPDADALEQVVANLEALAKLAATDEFEQLVPLLEQALPDEKERHLVLGSLYLRRQFADMAAEEFMLAAQRFGPDARSLTGLGKVATMKEMWEDAEVFLSESLKLDPHQRDAQRLLELIRERTAG